MKAHLIHVISACVLLLPFSTVANAYTITDGFTFSVAASAFDDSTVVHFHSSTVGKFGNPAGKAEVGSFIAEEVRGLSEYDLTGLTISSAAYVTFDIYFAGGLFDGKNDFPFTGVIDIFTYVGNNFEDSSDYHAPRTAYIGSFSPEVLSVGYSISFDITSIYNRSVHRSLSSLGIRLQLNPETSTNGGAWMFDNFRLTNDDQSTLSEPDSFF